MSHSLYQSKIKQLPANILPIVVEMEDSSFLLQTPGRGDSLAGLWLFQLYNTKDQCIPKAEKKLKKGQSGDWSWIIFEDFSFIGFYNNKVIPIPVDIVTSENCKYPLSSVVAEFLTKVKNKIDTIPVYLSKDSTMNDYFYGYTSTPGDNPVTLPYWSNNEEECKNITKLQETDLLKSMIEILKKEFYVEDNLVITIYGRTLTRNMSLSGIRVSIWSDRRTKSFRGIEKIKNRLLWLVDNTSIWSENTTQKEGLLKNQYNVFLKSQLLFSYSTSDDFFKSNHALMKAKSEIKSFQLPHYLK